MSERPNKPRSVAVLGGGAWGTTVALVAMRAGCEVTLFVRDETIATTMRESRFNPHSLEGVRLPETLEITAHLDEALDCVETAVLAVPTQSMRAFASQHQRLFGERTLVSAAKGLELVTLKRPSEILVDVLGRGATDRIAVLSGPNLAAEIAIGKPAASVIASSNARTARDVQHLLQFSTFRTYVSADVIGVELGGALKNIIAIGAGIADGLDVGANAKASLLTRGIAEITRLGVASGAEASTFGGLSGMGDLMATCYSALSRNYRVGVGIAAGRTLVEILEEQKETAEGITTIQAALELAKLLQVHLPIAEQLAHVLFENGSPTKAINDLMTRQATEE